jgi:hypothetical protein
MTVRSSWKLNHVVEAANSGKGRQIFTSRCSKLRQIHCRLLPLFVTAFRAEILPNDFVGGWCLPQMIRFSISENRRHSRSTERGKLREDWRGERPFPKSKRTEQLWSRGILEMDVDCAAV